MEIFNSTFCHSGIRKSTSKNEERFKDEMGQNYVKRTSLSLQTVSIKLVRKWSKYEFWIWIFFEAKL